MSFLNELFQRRWVPRTRSIDESTTKDPDYEVPILHNCVCWVGTIVHGMSMWTGRSHRWRLLRWMWHYRWMFRWLVRFELLQRFRQRGWSIRRLPGYDAQSKLPRPNVSQRSGTRTCLWAPRANGNLSVLHDTWTARFPESEPAFDWSVDTETANHGNRAIDAYCFDRICICDQMIWQENRTVFVDRSFVFSIFEDAIGLVL